MVSFAERHKQMMAKYGKTTAATTRQQNQRTESTDGNFRRLHNELMRKYTPEQTQSVASTNQLGSAPMVGVLTGVGSGSGTQTPGTPSVQRDIETVRKELAAANAAIKEFKASIKDAGVLSALANPVDGSQAWDGDSETQNDAKKLAELQNKRDALLEEYDRMTGADNRTWFQKGTFEDGYQRGDVTKAALATGSDIKEDVTTAVVGVPEKAVNAAAAIAPYNLAAQIQGTYNDPASQAGALLGQMLSSLFMGKDANYVQDQRNNFAAQALAEAKPAAEAFIKKDLYDEEKVAKWLIDNTTLDAQINKWAGVDTERDSVLGEKSDALVQSAGQLAAQYGLSLVGVPWFVTSAVTSFGSEVEDALGQGATLDEAVVSGAISAGAEILTEKLFGGDLFVKGAGFDDLVGELTKGISKKFVQKAAQLGLNAVGEGAEEWLSQRIGQFGQWLTYRHDERELLELLYSENSLNEAIEAFLGGVALGGGMGAVKTATTPQVQGGSVAADTAQVENGRAQQETAAEAQPGTLEWVKELNDLGAAKEAQKNAGSEETTVTVKGAGSAINESSMQNNTLGYKLASNLNAIRDMQPVKSLTGKEFNNRGVKLSDQIANFFKSLGNKVMRVGFGDVELGEYGVGGMMNHRPLNRAKMVSLAAVPDVIQNGRQISYEQNWKGRGYDSYIFAAPVTVNGTEVYVAAVVDKRPNNKFYLSEMVDSEGNYVRIEESPSGDSKNGVTDGAGDSGKAGVTARPEGLPEGGNPSAVSAEPMPLFNNSISKTEPGVNNISEKSVDADQDALAHIRELVAIGQGRSDGQQTVVDTGTQSNYDNINEQGGGVVSDEKRDETRDAFYRRANEANYTVRESGKISCGYNPATNKTGRAEQTEKALQELGIPVIVHEGLETNIDGVTRSINGEASCVAGDVVYVRNTMETDPIETAGHEAYHFWKKTDARLTYMEIIADNIVFSSNAFVQFQNDISEAYFGKEVGIEDDGSDKFGEEIFAYITGLVHAGDSDNIVRPFLRDYDAVKAAWDALVEKQAKSHSDTRAESDVKTTEPVAADSSVGAAPAWFDLNTRLQYQYGTLPSGENPVRSDDLPVSTDGTNRVSQTAVTVKGAQVTTDEFSDLLTSDVVEKNGMTYIPITNDATVQKAIDHITEEGWEAAKAQWQADVRNGKAGADLSAVGALLLNNAAKAGDKTVWLDILHDYQLLGTNTAQGLQALRILKKLSPSDKLYMAKRSVKQMVKDMKLDTDVTIDPELEAEYNNAETDEQRDAVLKKIQKNVARQLPTTFMEKFTALRYVNMLGNLRTQGRNIVGNLTMMGTRAIHNAVAAGIEAVANKASGGKVGRTRSLTVNKEQMASGRKDFDTLQEYVLDGGKYSDNMTATGFARGVQDEKQVFKFKPLEGYRKVTNYLMEKGDVIFAKEAYARALAGYLKANGITETDFSKVDTKIMDDARLFAAKEAQEATFRDTNWLSGWVSKIGRRKDTPAVGRFLAEGVMPFRKTPANVLVRAEEYSPLGVINSVVTSVKAAQKGSDVTANQVINSWAKTLTGTGLFGMGMLLAKLGLLSGGPDDDEKKEGFEDLNGWQDYAITLPDGTNFTIDSFSPSAIPMLMGAQFMKAIEDNGFQLKDLEKALTSIADPMVEMSMLQGVNDALENVQYSDNNLAQMAINAGLSYFTQGLTNTLFGQLERTVEDSRMQTYVDKDSDLPSWLQRTLGKASAKTPVWDFSQIPYINAWGEEEENPEPALNLVYNLLSPSYFDKGKDDELTRELNRLNDVQSENVYPSTPEKTVTINKQAYNLSADEYVSAAKLRGQTQKQLVEGIISSSNYAHLSDEEKAKAIRYAYEYARDTAYGEVIEEHPGVTTKWLLELDGDIAEGIIRHVATGTTTKYTGLSVSDASYVTELLDGLYAETGRTTVRDIQRIEAITGADDHLSDAQQKQVLKDTLTESAYDKYLQVLKLGMDNDDYAATYRTYLDEKETGGKGTKARIVAAFQKDLRVSESTAESLYNIYAGKK